MLRKQSNIFLITLTLLISFSFSDLIAQDSTEINKTAILYTNNIEPARIVYNSTRLMKGEDGTRNHYNEPSYIKLKGGSNYKIIVLYDGEGGEKISTRFVYSAGQIKTEAEKQVNGNLIVVGTSPAGRTSFLEVTALKTLEYSLMVTGEKLPDKGAYYKVIIIKTSL